VNRDGESVRYKLLYDLGCGFAARIEIKDLLPFVIEKCRDALDAEGASLLFLDREHNEFYFPYVAGADPGVAHRLAALRFPADRGIAGVALKTGRSIRIGDAQQDPRFYQQADKASGAVTRDLIATPLMTPRGALGVLEVVNHRGATPFSEEDVHFLEALAGSISIAIENARFYSEIKESEATLRTQMGALRRDLARQDRFHEMIGTAPAMEEVFQLMGAAAGSAITVLIEGATGSGKELVARGIHRSSARAENPFLALNCAAMPENLLESELFGHRRGAFTGALRDSPGLFRAASGGSLFLDEVGDMPLAMQAKLLRVLEEEEVVPVGETFPVKVDVRVLSATNRDLRAEVKRGTFREDLYYRLAVFPIRVPPLRARREDIPLLAHRFLEDASRRHHKLIHGIDQAAEQLLCNFSWPGNVRELQNEIERAVALAREGETIGPARLSAILREGSAASASELPPPMREPPVRAQEDHEVESAPADDGSLREARAAFEARYISEALERCHGNISKAARIIGVSRVQLQRKVKEYGLR